MIVSSQCPHCGAKYKVDGQLAGRKAKCGKCSAVIVIGSAKRPGVSAADLGRPSPRPAGKEVGLAPRGGQVACLFCGAVVAPDAPTCPVCDGPTLSGAAPSMPLAVPMAVVRRPALQKKSIGTVGIAGGAAVGTAVILIGLFVIFRPGPTNPRSAMAGGTSGVQSSPAAPPPQDAPAPAPAKPASDPGPSAPRDPRFQSTLTLVGRKPVAVPDPKGFLLLQWPPEEMVGVRLSVDGIPIAVPQAPIDLRVPVDPGTRHLLIQRAGFEPIEADLAIERGMEHVCRVNWTMRVGARRRPGGQVGWVDAESFLVFFQDLSENLGRVMSRRGLMSIYGMPDELGECKVWIDGHPMPPLTKKAPVEYLLPAGKHRVVIHRPGHYPIDAPVFVQEERRQEYHPHWSSVLPGQQVALTEPSSPEPITPERPAPALFDRQQYEASMGRGGQLAAPAPSFGPWAGELNTAQLRATELKRDILIAFSVRDGVEPSNALNDEILLHRDFFDQAEKAFVLVFVDSPSGPGPEYMRKVVEPERFKAMARTFAVRQIPTVILADAAARPYARLGYVAGGPAAFLKKAADSRKVRDEIDVLVRRIEAVPGEAKLEPTGKAFTLLSEQNLLGCEVYRPMAQRWLSEVQRFDGTNEKGALEVVFATWWLFDLEQLQGKSKKEITDYVNQLRDWTIRSSVHRFHDPDRAARLFLVGAGVLASLGDVLSARTMIQDGLAYEPRNPALAATLKQAAKATRALAMGTGFAVAPGGYVLTNNHVVEAASKVVVQLGGREEEIPAEIVARDIQQDMALLKVRLPRGVSLRPLPLSPAELRRGTRVGAFGFPAGEALGSGMKLTTGVISATPDQAPDGMMLLDCRINPGNSGGPLCDTSGNVVGMVTAKSLTTVVMDSYGIALPAKTIEQFLAQHLPNRAPAGPRPKRAAMEWQEIDQRVAPSVVMVIKKE